MAIEGFFDLSTRRLAAGCLCDESLFQTLDFSAVSDPNGLLRRRNLFTIPAGSGGTYLIQSSISLQDDQPSVIEYAKIVSGDTVLAALYLGGSTYSNQSAVLALDAGESFRIKFSNCSVNVALFDTDISTLSIVQIA